jgi:DNA repair exonuclease SbcCD ATPase subunit
LAYKIGLGQLIFESRTGRSLDLLILDEPTEALGTEDGSINALASALMNLKLIKQIIAVTHSEELAALAANRILVEKQKGISSIKSL